MNDGMKMHSGEIISSEYLDSLKLPPGNILSSVAVIHPVKKAIPVTYTLSGIITYDTRLEKNISSRYSGRIEKLNVKYMFQPVKQGEILFEIYSPEMVTAQQQLLFLLTNDSASQDLIAASKKKLLLLGMTAQQVVEVISREEPLYHLPVYSPYEGHIHEAYSATTQSEEMNETGRETLKLKEGMYVQKGQILFNLLDAHMVFAQLKIYPGDAKEIRLHQKVKLLVEGLEKKVIYGEIDFIDPILSPAAKTHTARVYLENEDHSLKVGTFVKGTLMADSISGTWIPKEASVNLGTRTIVWMKKENGFVAHEIKTGRISGGLLQVVDGINESDEIASNAAYLADSEDFITTK